MNPSAAHPAAKSTSHSQNTNTDHPEPDASGPIILRPLTEANLTRTYVTTDAKQLNSFNYKSREHSGERFYRNFTVHREGPKEGPTAVLAHMDEGQRKRNSVIALTCIGVDHDCGYPLSD